MIEVLKIWIYVLNDRTLASWYFRFWLANKRDTGSDHRKNDYQLNEVQIYRLDLEN